ncbi:MAG: hypothetical protein NVS2B5_20440 [Beijerinckiaceae bacterium]
MLPKDDYDPQGVLQELTEASEGCWRSEDQHRQGRPENGPERGNPASPEELGRVELNGDGDSSDSAERAREGLEMAGRITSETAMPQRGLTRLGEVPDDATVASKQRKTGPSPRRRGNADRRSETAPKAERRGRCKKRNREHKRMPAEVSEPGCPVQPRSERSPNTIVISDNVKALPGEDMNKHREFRRGARRYYCPENLYEQFRLSDVTCHQRQVERYQVWKEAAISVAIANKFYEIIRGIKPKLGKESLSKLWENGQPTERGLKILRAAGSDMDKVAGQVFFENLQSHGTMDAMLAHSRAARNEASRELELRREERARGPKPMELEFRQRPKEGGDRS